MSVILWVAVGFHVGLQDSELAIYLISVMLHCLFACLFVVVVVLETCDAAWQQTRDDLILSSFNFSIFSILLIVVASANLLGEPLITRVPTL